MSTKVVSIEVSQPLPQHIAEAEGYDRVMAIIFQQGIPLGDVMIDNARQPVSSYRLHTAIMQARSTELAREPQPSRLLPDLEPLPDQIFDLSLVICTRDRPDDLRRCLAACQNLRAGRHTVEIIVVDNNLASGLTQPVVIEYPNVRYVSDARKGVAYARNAGLRAAHGEIVAYIDDDVIISADWPRHILAPFADPHVMCVSGLVLPLEMETESQELFEVYGALGRGYVPRVFGSEFFGDLRNPRKPIVPTWDLGGTANVAIRKSVVATAGMFDETLGPGLPSGVGEDIYMFYRILKSGHLCYYEPAAYVWHKHRRDMAALSRQLYNYSKGQVSYQLRTLISDGDRRVLRQLGWDLPWWQIKRLGRILTGRFRYPLNLYAAEVRGNLVGPYAFAKSIALHRRNAR